ncbi:LacI family DNA-binding transcriptional regulator [Amycolatopsis sp. CA-126428]|uniref:LacI family DNA-binding transcriptional regulator n=1 Tax=Amycolatopsis sp. CA-126428 TaxID=2073158 RepID=UPI000CD2D59A|nr:LacI family DNA-binding transcriptional regulator [Amycolatopsis sp. CA-126428]
MSRTEEELSAERKPAKRATLSDVAELAQVSVATVSRVLAGNYPVAKETRRRVERAIAKTDYVVNTHARALAGVSTQSVAFVVNDVRGQSFAYAAQGVELEAARRGRICLVCTTQGDLRRETAVVQLMREQGAAAVILIGGVVDDTAYRTRMTELAHSLAAVGSRLVLCGRPPLGDDVPVTVVEYDNEGGAYAVASHLLTNGHRRILFVGHVESSTTTRGRLAGYRRALAAFDLELDSDLVVEADFTRASAHRAVQKRLAQGRDFTAIFAESDVIAAGAMRALIDAGLSVPDDVSIVGYDDIEAASDLRPRLTTVHVPYEELGSTAVRLALDWHEGVSGSIDQHVVLGTHVVLRESVARL